MRKRLSSRTSLPEERMQLHLQWFGSLESRVGLHHRVPGDEVAERCINQLPALASEFYNDKFQLFGWGPTLRQLLVGTRDSRSSLCALRGFESMLLKHICSYISCEWAKHVTLTIPAYCVGRVNNRICRFNRGRTNPEFLKRELIRDLPLGSRMTYNYNGDFNKGYVAFAACGIINFPDPADRNVNMMPFMFGKESSLPPDLQCYYDCIEQCPYLDDETGKIGYLTVHESYVEAGTSQRREGLHIEAPGSFVVKENATFSPAREHSWGCGLFHEPDYYEGGIYMASTVDNSSEVWDALVNKNVEGIVDRHGNCEHLRRLIGPGTKLEAKQLIWMTDCTPHQALPQESSCYRQFFRVVTSNISHWFADHSTPNPLVSLPDHVKVVHGNKLYN